MKNHEQRRDEHLATETKQRPPQQTSARQEAAARRGSEQPHNAKKEALGPNTNR